MKNEPNEPDRYPQERPKTRAGCYNMPRPCPFVTCRHHLYLNILGRRIFINQLVKGLPIEEALDKMPQTCSLDAAEKGGMTLQELADVFGLSRERLRQIQVAAQQRAAQIGARRGIF